MSSHEIFLEELLAYHTLPPDSPELKSLVAEGEKLLKLIDERFDPRSIHKREGGSKAKGTMVRGGYDYDLGFYVDAGDNSLGETLEEIAENTEKCLGDHYEFKPKTIAIQLISKVKDHKGQKIGIDLVIGRFEDTSRNNAWVTFRGTEKDRLKTNILTHVNHVRNSGCVEIIRLMKVWKLGRGLEELKTFPLELATIKILGEGTAPHAALSARLEHVFSQLAEIAETISLQDPANPNGNNIERIFGSSERSLLKSESRRAIAAFRRGGWQEVFGEIPATDPKTQAPLFSIGISTLQPVKPWSE